jgi:hypothetical protein
MSDGVRGVQSGESAFKQRRARPGRQSRKEDSTYNLVGAEAAFRPGNMEFTGYILDFWTSGTFATYLIRLGSILAYAVSLTVESLAYSSMYL